MKKRKRVLRMTHTDFTMTTSKALGGFTGKWVSMVDNEVIAKGNDAKHVFAQAKKKYPNKIPLVMKVPTDGVMLL